MNYAYYKFVKSLRKIKKLNNNDNENIKKLNDNEIINDMNYIQKYDEESNFIEKEIQFYDYDDSLLGYRH